MSERELFLAALDIENLEERARFLADRCAAEPEKLQRLQQLLLAKSEAENFLEVPAVGDSDASGGATRTFGDPATGSFRPAPSAEEAEGTIIAGRYKLRQRIGEGGMGTVWMADQTEPVKRKVAVKLIRVERGQSKTILARFEAERQAIALMDHPHIAKLLDAGTTETGSPFFVMELVKGVPLNDYCDEHKLTIHERLNLFTQICSAVQHAHQKGIIHRDLKPGNILVESHDGKPVPKVIDFGLAKATTGLQLTDHSMFTAFGSVMGTPLYMAPEQATFNAVDVDTRADVYALGVILYELLTGTTPITRDTLKKAALDEMLKLIREQEAPTPSSRLSSAESAPSVAANRLTELAKLGRFVKGELDWIVLKALSKDRDRRYETANGFARDIERFLNHEPVTAGPVSTSYRFKKFVRRNRGQVLAAGLVLLALVAGVAGTSLGLIRAEQAREREVLRADGERAARLEAQRARDEEELARRDAARQAAAASKARAAAERSEADALAFADFLANSVLSAPRPKGIQGGTGPDVTLADALRHAEGQIDRVFKNAPRAEALARNAIGVTWRTLGRYGDAERHLRRALELWEREAGPESPEAARTRNSLGVTLGQSGQADEAERLLVRVVDWNAARFGPAHRETLVARVNLAGLWLSRGEVEKARVMLEKLLADGRNLLPPDQLLVARGNLAGIHLLRREFRAAETMYRELIPEIEKEFGNDGLRTIECRNNLALALVSQGRLTEAVPVYRKALDDALAALTLGHPLTRRARDNLIRCHERLGERDTADAIRRKYKDPVADVSK